MQLYLFPFIAAFLNWLFFALLIRKFLGKNHSGRFGLRSWIRHVKPQAAAGIGELVQSKLQDPALQTQLRNQRIEEAVRPELARWLDDFVTHKMKEKWPVLAMFLDEKMMVKMKTALDEELEAQLPKILSRVGHHLGARPDIKRFVAGVVMDLPDETIYGHLITLFQKPFRQVQVAAAIGGALIGLLLVVLL